MIDPLAPVPDEVMARPRSAPARVETSSRLDAISVGAGHACARTESGALLCWGMDFLDAYGETCAPLRAPVTVFASGVEWVRAGHYFTCALVDGERQCLGASPSVALLEDGVADHSAMGGAVMTSCGLVAGRVLCEGATDGGLTGKDPGKSPTLEQPEAIAGIADARSLSLGTHHGCVRTDGQAWCWGSNSLGQTGRPRAGSGRGAARVELATGVVDVQCGSQHSCALLEDATVQCWGHNFSNQVGAGPPGEPRPPTVVYRSLTEAVAD